MLGKLGQKIIGYANIEIYCKSAFNRIVDRRNIMK